MPNTGAMLSRFIPAIHSTEVTLKQYDDGFYNGTHLSKQLSAEDVVAY